MRFDPATLMTVTCAALLVFSLLSLVAGTREARCHCRFWWTGCFLLGASGFALLMVAPDTAGSPGRDLANLTFLLAYGCCLAGARCLAGRIPRIGTVVAGAAAWALIGFVWNPGFGLRMTLASLLVAAYAAATAAEFSRGAAPGERARRAAAVASALHAAFYLARAILGPTFMAGVVDETAVSSWGAITAFEVMLYSGALVGLVLASSRERCAAEERRAAHTDFLTGIANRRAFEEVVPALLRRSRDEPMTLLSIDLDRFKLVNDRFGHPAGDHLLRCFSQAFARELDRPDLFWRLGGDEFAVLLRGAAPGEIHAVQDRLRRTAAGCAEVQAASRGIAVSFSVGAATAEPGETLASLVSRADAALYAAKRQERARAAAAAAPAEPATCGEMASELLSCA